MKNRHIGTTSRGIRCPIIREGDDLSKIVVTSVLDAREDGVEIHDRDVIAITESIVARSEGNYCSVDDIAEDVKEKFPKGEIGLLFPILSRNRFAICLRGIARGVKKITLMFSYPSDEVGNALLTYDEVDEAGINPYSDCLSLEKYRSLFGYKKHEFTGVDYISYYKEIIEAEGAACEIIFGNDPRMILPYAKEVIAADIHTKERTKRFLLKGGAEKVYTLTDIMSKPVNGSGFNENYGLLGSNKATETTVKLFPHDATELVNKVQEGILEATGKHVEVMIYGDGAFKDPKGEIWEFADPVVSPTYTKGLEGTPNELKLKFLADNDFASLSGKDLKEAIEGAIAKKDAELKGKMASEGTTPRRITDLLGSLADLTSGSGDKGTPIVLIQGYFDNYTNN